MQIIRKDRGQGKTTELLKIAQKNQYGFVCLNQQELHRIKAMQVDIPFLLTFQQLKSYQLRGRACDGIVIDNVDMFISNTLWTENWEDSHTEQLIRLSAEHWKYISVPDHETAYSIASRADELGLNIPFPVQYGENCYVKPLLLYHPEIYLQYLAGRCPVKYVTLSEVNTINITSNIDSIDRLED